MKFSYLIFFLASRNAFAKLGSVTLSSKGEDGEEVRNLKKIDNLGGNPKDDYPLQHCQGDCDKDSDCDTGLVCFDKPPNTKIPGCEGGENDSSRSDYCVYESDLSGGPAPTPQDSGNKFLKFKGNNGNPSSNYPLGLCEGDCDGDWECEGNLVCFQRSGGKFVPGCLGNDSSSNDYCIHPDNTNSPPKPNPQPTPSPPDTSERFQLKLYWEEGYYWQEETKERKWCMMHHYDKKKKCWYGRNAKSCRDDQIYISKCSGDKRQEFQFVDLPNDEVLIKLGYENKCFQRYGRQIYLESCDEGNSKQRWYAPNGDFDGSRFEISQHGYSSQCMTQDHHPKEAEVVELHSCSAARSKSHETSYWNKY